MYPGESLYLDVAGEVTVFSIPKQDVRTIFQTDISELIRSATLQRETKQLRRYNIAL